MILISHALPALAAFLVAARARARREAALSHQHAQGDQDPARRRRPHNRADLRDRVPVDAGRAKYKAWVYTTWTPTGSGGVRPKQFEDYNVTARLELNHSGPDRDLGKRTCKIAARLNRLASGSYTCQTGVEGNFGTAGRFTGDGSVIYDVDGDGKGNFNWPLTGSPAV